MQAVNIGILGLGTVGGGTAQVLQDNAAEISRRLGREVRVTAVCTRNTVRARQLCPQAAVVTEPTELVQRDDVDIVVELYGGTEIAKDAVLQAIENGKHIVTANKKLLAEYGNEIFPLAEEKNVMVQFEAAVAGGIPIIIALREGLAANRIRSIAGIINGTSNFILSEMREKGSAFADVLKEAQALGYAEADPTFDIEGNDAGHKITIMSALAFGTPMNFPACYLEGISKLDSRDIKYAEELGYRIKLLGITRKTDKGIELRVHPTLIPESRLLANVNGVMNAVQIQGNAIGNSLYYGPGAGKLPTASAVVADLIDVVRELNLKGEDRLAEFGYSEVHDRNSLPVLPADAFRSAYYLRLTVADRAGVLADITRILADNGISINSVSQKNHRKHNDHIPLVLLTETVSEAQMNRACEQLAALPAVSGAVKRIRVENFA